jgi:hypothetical protein
MATRPHAQQTTGAGQLRAVRGGRVQCGTHMSAVGALSGVISRVCTPCPTWYLAASCGVRYLARVSRAACSRWEGAQGVGSAYSAALWGPG